MKYAKQLSSLFILVSLLLLSSCKSTKTAQNTATAEYNLKGKVKKVSKRSYRTSNENGTILKGYRGKSYEYRYEERDLTFDEAGNLLMITEVDTDDSINSKKVREYNDKGQLVRLDEYGSDISSPFKTTIYSYTDAGKLSQERINYGNSGRTTYYQYGAENQLTGIKAMTQSDEEESLAAKTTVTYSNTGKKEVTSYYTENGNLESEYIKLFDKNGNMIESDVDKDGGNAIIPKHTYTYNEQGQMLSESNFLQSDELLSTSYYEYDKDGRIILEKTTSFDDKGLILPKKKYAYNEQGDPVSIIEYDDKGAKEKELRFKYTYDNNENWTQFIFYIDDRPDVIVERSIMYYP